MKKIIVLSLALLCTLCAMAQGPRFKKYKERGTVTISNNRVATARTAMDDANAAGISDNRQTGGSLQHFTYTIESIPAVDAEETELNISVSVNPNTNKFTIRTNMNSNGINYFLYGENDIVLIKSSWSGLREMFTFSQFPAGVYRLSIIDQWGKQSNFRITKTEN